MENYSPVFTITPEIMSLAYKIAGTLERISIIQEQALSPQLRRVNRIRTIHSSLLIEANTLSLDEVADVIDGKTVTGPAKDIQEVKNAMLAYQKLLDCNPYIVDDLLSQHKILMDGLDEGAGAFRRGNVGVFDGQIPVHVAPPPRNVSELMNQLLDWVKNSELPQVVKSCIFHYEFEFIHPFSDGNGRMGRMWQTLLLYQENPVFGWLPVETIVAERQFEYYDAIRLSTMENNSGVFALFMLQALFDALEELRNSDELRKTVNQSERINDRISERINDTEQAVLIFIKDSPYATYDDISSAIGKSYSATQRAVQGLKKKGFITREGSRKSGMWRVLKEMDEQKWN
jgi:Fic family protein